MLEKYLGLEAKQGMLGIRYAVSEEGRINHWAPKKGVTSSYFSYTV